MGNLSGRGLQRQPKAMCSVRGCERARRGDEEVAKPITEFRDSEIFMTLSPPRENTLEESPDSSPGPQPHVPQLFRASLKVSLAEERGLDDPAGLTRFDGL
jgi:hypothetical protein